MIFFLTVYMLSLKASAMALASVYAIRAGHLKTTLPCVWYWLAAGFFGRFIYTCVQFYYFETVFKNFSNYNGHTVIVYNVLETSVMLSFLIATLLGYFTIKRREK